MRAPLASSDQGELRRAVEQLDHPAEREAQGAAEGAPVRQRLVHCTRGLRVHERRQSRDEEHVGAGLVEGGDPPAEVAADVIPSSPAELPQPEMARYQEE